MSRRNTPTKIRKRAILSCKRKISYQTIQAATEAGLAAESDGIIRGQNWHAYHCRFCGLYHWGRIGPTTDRIDAAFSSAAASYTKVTP